MLAKWLQRLRDRLLVRSISTQLFLYVLGGALVALGTMAAVFYRSIERESLGRIRAELNAQVEFTRGQLLESQRYIEILSAAVLTNRDRNIQDPEFYKQLTLEFFKQRPSLVLGVGFGQNAFQVLRDRQWFYPYFYVDQGQPNPIGERLPPPHSDWIYSELYKDDQYPDQHYWRIPVGNQKGIWIEPYEWSNIVMTSYLVPFYDSQKNLVGVAGTDFSVTELSKRVDRSVINNEGYFAILSRSGKLLAYPPKRKSLQANSSYRDLPLLRELWPILQSKNSDIIYHQDQIIAYERIPSANWIAIAVVPSDVVLGPLWRILIISVSIAAILLAIAVLGFVRRLNRQLKPILEKCNTLVATEKIMPMTTPKATTSEAVFAFAVRDRQHMDELTFLCHSFDQMAAKVEATLQSLAETNQTLQATVQDRSEALNQLQQTQLQLIQSEKMSGLGQLLAGIAHEINNPVNFIHGNLDYVRDYVHELLQATTQVYAIHAGQASQPNGQASIDFEELAFIQADLIKILDSMTVGTDRIRQLVLSLRTFSRTDQTKDCVTNLHHGIESTLLLLKHRLKATSDHPAIEVITKYGDLPPVECYPGPLNQVFMNLLVNAIDALEQKTAGWSEAEIEANPSRIEITTQFIASENVVEISIADNGPGIPESVQARIFDPFFTTKPVGKGTGLGLSISYQVITERHQGKIFCRSQPNQGTQFIIHLPAGINQQNPPFNHR